MEYAVYQPSAPVHQHQTLGGLGSLPNLRVAESRTLIGLAVGLIAEVVALGDVATPIGQEVGAYKQYLRLVHLQLRVSPNLGQRNPRHVEFLIHKVVGHKTPEIHVEAQVAIIHLGFARWRG